MALFKNKYRLESTRLSQWDYSNPGRYFVTICTRDREPFFGDVIGHKMHLSPIGRVAHLYWLELPRHSPANVKIDAVVVMPNHVHGIVVIEDVCEETSHPEETLHSVETLHATSLQNDGMPFEVQNTPLSAAMSKISPKAGSLAAVARSYKSAVTRQCRLMHNPFFDWQPRFFDRIIRDEDELEKIRMYIDANPTQWDYARDNPVTLWM